MVLADLKLAGTWREKKTTCNADSFIKHERLVLERINV